MSISIRLLTALTFLTLSAVGSGCGGKKFSSSASKASGDDVDGRILQECTNQLHQATIPIKLLFVIDTSGSNASNASGYIGTDNHKVVRGQSIQEFFNTYRTKTNFSWAFNIFSGTDSYALIGYDHSRPAFTTDPGGMHQAINSFFGITDADETPYMAALNLAKAALVGDNRRTAQTKWVIVFLSDGLPNPDVDQATLNAKVANIVGTIPGQVSFNTVYYGTADAAAAARLEGMANAGGGKFLNTNNSGRSFPIQYVVTVPGVCP